MDTIEIARCRLNPETCLVAHINREGTVTYSVELAERYNVNTRPDLAPIHREDAEVLVQIAARSTT